MRALIEIMFPAARGEHPFIFRELSVRDFANAYNCLDVIQELDVLVEHTADRLKRSKEGVT